MPKNLLRAITVLFLFAIWAITNITTVGQNGDDILFPVEGRLLVTRERTLHAIDVGNNQDFSFNISTSAISTNGSAFFDPNGNKVSYIPFGEYDIELYDFNSNDFFRTPRINGYRYELYKRFSVERWIDSDRFLLRYRDEEINLIGVYDLISQNFQPVLSSNYEASTVYELKKQIPTLVLDSIVEDSFIFLHANTLIYPNPVFRNWLIARIEIYGPDIYSEDLEGYIPVYRENLFILWNFETGESIVLNGFFEFTGDFGTAWSEDGQRVFIGTLDPITRQNYIETFHVDVLTELTGIQHVYSTPISSRQTLLEGFGSSDLLLIYEVLEDKQTLISISDVTNDKYKSRPFINQVGTFSDFHLAESEERRRELSCLFDQTLPAQVSVGGFAQVASSAVALRAGAAITDDVLVTLTTGTGFEVIRAPECRDGYRWWPVRLPDGTEGFVAEASTDEYFIAPVPPAP